MKLNLRIEYNTGEPQEVTCSAADLVAFEKQFDISVVKLESELRFTYLLYLAHHAAYRLKLTALELDAWTETVASVGPSDINPSSKA